MSTTKRKAVTIDKPNKKPKSRDEDATPTKLAKKQQKPDKKDESERKPLRQSILQDEERAFPRGGASILTPIEQKQIKAQAERDVLFEQHTGQRAPATNEDGDLFDEGASAAASKKKRKQSKLDGVRSGKNAGSTVKIQGLSYKSLEVGSLVLGHVASITGRDIALTLSNNLTGYVSITSVSDVLNDRIEKFLDQEQNDARPDSDDGDVDLKSLFHVGQWLRAVVTSPTSNTADGKQGKRRIELSIDPKQVNATLDPQNVAVNGMIQASVRSVEDHGIVMDLGLADTGVKGFVSKKELGVGWTMDTVQEGQVMMCLVTGKSSKVMKLSPDAARFSVMTNDKNAPVLDEAPTIDAFLPGTATTILVTDTSIDGVVGKIMGMLDVTADLVHTGATGKDFEVSKKFKIGSKIKARIMFSLPKDDGSRRVGISVLETLLTLPPPSTRLPENASAKLRAQIDSMEQTLPLSSIVDNAVVTRIMPERALYLRLPTKNGTAIGIAHISQISDSHIDSISSSSGQFKLDSAHKVRVMSYNSVDNVYYVSTKKSILEQPFLLLEDLSIGQIVQGTVDRLVLGGKNGIMGVIVQLSEGISGLVPWMHLSDAQLLHPERKFHEGLKVKARILSVDVERRQIRLTLKKSLLNADDEVTWTDYTSLKAGMESDGTIVSLLANGAAVQFFGEVRAWLPVSEMSESFVDRPESHFRIGQTVHVRILSVDAQKQDMKVTCKHEVALDASQLAAWESLQGGQTVTGTVTSKNRDTISVDLANDLRGVIRVGHLADGGESKVDKALGRIRIGQVLQELAVLYKSERNRHAVLTAKSSLIGAAKSGELIRSFADVQTGQKVHGFVRNITADGIYTEFFNEIVAFLPRSQVLAEMTEKESFGLLKDQTVHARVLSADIPRERFVLSMKEAPENDKPRQERPGLTVELIQPVDRTLKSTADIVRGRKTKARIASVKGTQINVRLADNVQGRIDASEAFDSWDDIENAKAPLQKFAPNQVLDVTVLGVHDARNHRFLPITHRQSGFPVYELSAKKSPGTGQGEDLSDLQSVKEGEVYTAFVNNHGDDCIWVNLSPNVRGRISLLDLSDDVVALQNLNRNFPLGTALRVTVKKVNVANGRLDLSARSGRGHASYTIDNLAPGVILPARLTKISERSINVQISDTIAGPVPLVELSDDYDDLNFGQYEKTDVVRVCVLDLDVPNKKVFLSLRRSKTLSSSLHVKDRQIQRHDQLKSGDLIRGFVKHIGDKGVLVSIGARIDAFVRIAELSDDYIKDWKTLLEIDQLVKGRILSVDEGTKQIMMTLKSSQVDENYKPPLTMNDLKESMIVTGRVRKVEDFGAFIDLDNTRPRISGLCHRSEVAEKRVSDVRTLYSEGDIVKAKILKVDVDARKVSLGLKASYFISENDGDDAVDEDADIDLDDDDDDDEDVVEDMELDDDDDIQEMGDSESDGGVEVDASDNRKLLQTSNGLKTGGFDWSGNAANCDADDNASESEMESSTPKKRKRTKAEIKVDLTGDLDKFGPRSVSDFERQLLGQPNDSALWISYMAFQLQLGELQKVRALAERALRTIHIRDTEEKANIWIAWLNLEAEYGDDESVEEVFKEACQVQDPLSMHEKLASIYIDSGKHDKAEAIFDRIVGNKTFRASPEVWLNNATFLMETTKDAQRARALLPRALQSVPSSEHRMLTAKFAALEFRSQQGDAERGRTIFEGLVTEWPKWASGWDMWVDLERARLTHARIDKMEVKTQVRALFERMIKPKIGKRRAKFLFKKWLDFEEAEGDKKSTDRVKELAREYVESQQADRGDE